jgi:glycine cleavage system H lipoate-binding protein
MVILIFIAFIVASLALNAVVQLSRRNSLKIMNPKTIFSKSFNEASVLAPKGIFFDKTHTWAFMEKSGEVKIGIDDFLLHITGPINRVKMKQPGAKISKGEPAITIIQNGKQLNINAPISGTVLIKNDLLVGDSSLLNQSPVQDGWIYSIEPSNWERESQFLFMADKYKEWLKNEFARFKDFLAYNRFTSKANYMPVMLQDGGELNDNLLSDFGPDVWEEFQDKFINTSK